MLNLRCRDGPQRAGLFVNELRSCPLSLLYCPPNSLLLKSNAYNNKSRPYTVKLCVNYLQIFFIDILPINAFSHMAK